MSVYTTRNKVGVCEEPTTDEKKKKKEKEKEKVSKQSIGSDLLSFSLLHLLFPTQEKTIEDTTQRKMVGGLCGGANQKKQKREVRHAPGLCCQH